MDRFIVSPPSTINLLYIHHRWSLLKHSASQHYRIKNLVVLSLLLFINKEPEVAQTKD